MWDCCVRPRGHTQVSSLSPWQLPQGGVLSMAATPVLPRRCHSPSQGCFGPSVCLQGACTWGQGQGSGQGISGGQLLPPLGRGCEPQPSPRLGNPGGCIPSPHRGKPWGFHEHTGVSAHAQALAFHTHLMYVLCMNACYWCGPPGVPGVPFHSPCACRWWGLRSPARPMRCLAFALLGWGLGQEQKSGSFHIAGP